MRIIFLVKQYGCSTASFKIRILKGFYFQNEKGLEAQILTGVYWDYIYVDKTAPPPPPPLSNFFNFLKIVKSYSSDVLVLLVFILWPHFRQFSCIYTSLTKSYEHFVTSTRIFSNIFNFLLTSALSSAMGIRKKIRRQFYFYFCRRKR